MTKQANPILIRFHCFEEDLAEDCQEAVTQKPQTERLREREREGRERGKENGKGVNCQPSRLFGGSSMFEPCLEVRSFATRLCMFCNV